MEQTYICDNCRTSYNMSSNLTSTSVLIWSAISITSSLTSSNSCLSQSVSSSWTRRCLFEGRWLAVSSDSKLRFPAELGTSYESLIRVTVAKIWKNWQYRSLGLIYSNLNCIENILVSESFLGQLRTRQLRWRAGRSVLHWWGSMSTARWFVGRVDWRVRCTFAYSNWRKTYVIRV